MVRRITAFLTAVLMAALLTACELEALAPFFEGQEEQAALPAGSTSYEDFLIYVEEIKNEGDRTADLGLTVLSGYYYSFSAASAGALRYAIEYILWLRGEGASLAALTAESPCVGWENLAAVNFSSPYPSYFEGLLLELQGDREGCIEPYAAASVMYMFPEEGLDFYYLRDMETPTLYAVRSTLLQVEKAIYSVYTPDPAGQLWDRSFFDPELLVSLSAQAVKEEKYEEALWYARQALKADPYDPVCWRNGAVCGIYAMDWEFSGRCIDEGLAIFPGDGDLLKVKEAFFKASDRMEVQR